MNINLEDYEVTAVLPANEPKEMSDEELKIFYKCMEDPFFFIETFVKIPTSSGAAQFRLFPYQREIIDAYHKQRYTILLAARQMGKCVTPNTIIKVNDNDIQIGELVFNKLSTKQKCLYLYDYIINFILQKLK